MKTLLALRPIAICALLLPLAAGCQHLERFNPPPAPDFRVHYHRFDTHPKTPDAERLAVFAEEAAVDGVVHYEVVGHAYDRKSSGSNFSMGKRRAEVVRDMLVAAGVPAEQVNARSLGDTRPRIPYHNFGRREKFNRVEVFRVVAAD